MLVDDYGSSLFPVGCIKPRSPTNSDIKNSLQTEAYNRNAIISAKGAHQASPGHRPGIFTGHKKPKP